MTIEWQRLKTQYNVTNSLRPKSNSKTNNNTSNININDILLRPCNHSSEICLQCKKCNKQSYESFCSTKNSIKKAFKNISHSCKKYRRPLRIGNVYTIKKKTKMRNRVKRLFKRSKRARRN